MEPTSKIVATALALALAACSTTSAQPAGATAGGPTAAGAGGPPGPAGAASPAAAAAIGPQDRCEVHVSGEETLSYVGARPRGPHGGGKLVATSDYWMTDDELRTALATIASLGKKSKDDVDAAVAAALRADPRFMLLLVNCGVDGQGFLTLSPARGSRYEDLPFGPGTYPLADASTAAPGSFRALLTLEAGGRRENVRASAPGTVTITRFDATGIAGTVAFPGTTSTGHAVSVTASFDYGCTGGRCR